jgi:hypothetical protein
MFILDANFFPILDSGSKRVEGKKNLLNLFFCSHQFHTIVIFFYIFFKYGTERVRSLFKIVRIKPHIGY